MPASYNVEWLNSNNLRSYPFKEDTSKKLFTLNGVDTGMSMPDDMLVDAQIVVPYTDTPVKVYLREILKYATGVTMKFYIKENADYVFIGSCVIGIDDDPYTIYTLTSSAIEDTKYSGCIYRLISGTRSNSIIDGSYTCNIEMESDVVRPALGEVRSISILSDTEIIGPLYGDINLVAGDNIIFTVEDNTVTINAIDTSNMEEEDCDCGDSAYKDKQCIYTINNIPPDGDGNFKLVPGTCISIDSDGSVVIADTCSEPCCGCAELEKISESYKILDSSINRITSNVSRLAEEQSTLYSKYILTLFRQYMEWL